MTAGDGATNRAAAFGEDDVAFFVRRSRGLARDSTERLEQLARHRKASAARLAQLVASPPVDTTSLLDELLARDDELSAATQELQEQVEALTRATTLLERERSKYADLFANAPDAYVLTDLRGIMQEVNVAAGALLSADASFLRGRPLVTFVARNDTRTFQGLLHALSDEAPRLGTARSLTVRMRPRGQPVFVCQARVSPVEGASGRPIGLRWTLRRVDVREAAASIKIADAELARQIVEDFRSPVMIIAGWARLLLEGTVDTDEERRQALAWIEQSAASQRVMLDDLAELSQLCSENDVPPSLAVVDVMERIQAAVESLRACIEPGSLAIASAAPRQPMRARTPGGYLDRALDLLLRRALAGTPRNGGAVRVHVSVVDAAVVVRVQAPEGAQVPSGWGVRMASVARIAAMCGGRLALTDRSPTADLALPIAPP